MNIGKIILAGMAAVFLCATVQAQVADRIVAVVNDEVITLSELNKAFENYREGLATAGGGKSSDAALKDAKMNLLGRMIDNLLMRQESQKAGITVQEDEAAKALDNMLKQQNVSRDQFLKALEKEGITLEEYLKDFRDQLIRMKLVRRDIKSRVTVTDEEIGQYYLKHREDYEGKESVRIRQIMIPFQGNNREKPEDKEKIRAKAEAIRKALIDGESFEQVFRRYAGKPFPVRGGDTGYIEKGAILHEVEKVAFGLPINQISNVIESSAGFHIIQVIDRRGAGLKDIENVRGEIREKIDREKTEKKFEEWLKELRDKSHIEIKL